MMVSFIKVKRKKKTGFEKKGNKFNVGHTEFKGPVISLSSNVHEAIIYVLLEPERDGLRFRPGSH